MAATVESLSSSPAAICLPEIIEQILEKLDPTHLEDVRCLQACSSVSRDFQYLARKGSFQTIELRSCAIQQQIPGLRSYTSLELFNLLQKSPHFVPFIKRLNLAFPRPALDSAQSSSEDWVMLSDLFALLTNVQSVIISHFRLSLAEPQLEPILAFIRRPVARVTYIINLAHNYSQYLGKHFGNSNPLRLTSLFLIVLSAPIPNCTNWEEELEHVLQVTKPTLRRLNLAWNCRSTSSTSEYSALCSHSGAGLLNATCFIRFHAAGFIMCTVRQSPRGPQRSLLLG
jgi:hypothetical protein